MKRSGSLILALGFAALMFTMPTAVAANGDRLTLGHVTITLPMTVEPVDMSSESGAAFYCTRGSEVCRIDVHFESQMVQPYDIRRAESLSRTVIDANTRANLFMGYVFSTSDYTTQTRLTGITTTYEFRDRYGVYFILDTFTMVDGFGDIRTVAFMYQGSTWRDSFTDGQTDWYAMIDGMTIHGS